MSFYNPINIPNTLDLVNQSWQNAEYKLQDQIRQFNPGAGEEYITEQFRVLLSEELKRASEAKEIENAFLNDLKSAFAYNIYEFDLYKIAQGLIAQVTEHKRKTEAKTGGDLGLVIIRPEITHGFDDSLIVQDYRRGLLCQAKLKKADNRWGSFTKRQIEILADHVDHLALLLYSYQDQANRNLQKFQWQICSQSDITSVRSWLKHNQFPNILDSASVINGLGSANIGTDDNQIIDDFISPKGNRNLVIKIWWPDNSRPPGSSISIYSSNQLNEEQERNLLIYY